VLAAVAVGELLGWLPWIIEGYCASVVQSKGSERRRPAEPTVGFEILKLLIFPSSP
jgi:hypothetical protein